jgi:hypothetical protein
MPNEEVEGPRDQPGRATRAHTVFPRPRSQTNHASRPLPTIVRLLPVALLTFKVMLVKTRRSGELGLCGEEANFTMNVRIRPICR